MPARDGQGRCLRSLGGSAQRPVLRSRSSYGLAQFVKMFHADAAALAGIRPDLFDRNDVLMLVAPGIPDEDREGADEAEDRQPPDVPDDRESADRGEEGADYADRRVQRHFDRLVIGLIDQPFFLDRG